MDDYCEEHDWDIDYQIDSNTLQCVCVVCDKKCKFVRVEE